MTVTTPTTLLHTRAKALLLVGIVAAPGSAAWSITSVNRSFSVLSDPKVDQEQKAEALAGSVTAERQTRPIRTSLFYVGLLLTGLGIAG